MKEISKNNLIKLYIDEANNGEENKLLVFQVKCKGEAAKVYQDIKKKVKRVRVAYFQNGLVGGISTRITEHESRVLYGKFIELKELNKDFTQEFIEEFNELE
jgi:Ni,Fe-hydrogenase I large subunit